jgi:hypothetical protein
VLESISVFLKQVYEIASIITKCIYDFGMAIANDPVVKYVTRTLIAPPLLAAANFLVTVFLAV